MRKRLTILVGLILLSSAFNILAQMDVANDSSESILTRRAQPARLELPGDAPLSLDSLGVLPAATNVPVTVDATRTIRSVDQRFPAINTAIWDSSFESRTTITLLQAMGTTLLRFPGGWLSDEYHWKTNT